MAIYNTGRYLNQSIGSLKNQTINFDNIQIILVNDGSTDDSEEICLKYKEKYYRNIIYLKIEHSGVSKARNIGLQYAKGKYINFLDTDDLWDFQAFKYALLFFNFYKNVDIISGRLKYFEAKNTYHPLDYKFYKSRVVNLTTEYNCIQMSASSTFFKNSIIKGQKFPENVFSGEDTVFINNILLLKPKIGLLKEVIYYYRRRADSSSAVQNQGQKFEFYFSQLKYVGQYLLDRSKELYNKLVPFIQFYIGYDILFRIISPAYKFLENNDFINYCLLIENQLHQIDDKYILEQKFTNYRTKLFALSKKYKRDVRDDLIIINDLIIYYGREMINLTKSNNLIIWKFLDIKDNILQLEGKDNFWMPKDKYFYFCLFGNKTFFPKYYDYSGFDFNTMYGLSEKGKMVTFNIPMGQNNEQNIKFFVSYNNENVEIFPSLGTFTHIPTIKFGYYSSGEYIIKLFQRRLTIYKYDKSLERQFENQYCKVLRNLEKDNIIELRENYYKNKEIDLIANKKEIWIINDKRDQAGDNGEYFFRYLKNKNLSNIDIYFAIKRECNDYNRLKQFGGIIDLDSKNYLNIFLRSDKIISSVSDSWISNPFYDDKKYISDLFHFDVIFIQNGIIADDLSEYLNRINTNFSLIFTSSKKEYKSVLSPRYHYKKNNVKLTGLSRYDKLLELSRIIDRKKLILIIPAYREYILGTRDLITLKSIYSNNFKNTTFFKFYNTLINDQKIKLQMENHNFKGILCLHPYFSEQIIDFTENKYFKIQSNCNLQELLIKSSLLITDYSDKFFDFAYLKKPILYLQFDIKEYRKYQYPEGYFDYSKDGFGKVCYNLICLENELNEMISSGCMIKKKYMRRILKFFQFSDNNNNDRIYYEIISFFEEKQENQSQFKRIIIVLFFVFLIYKIKQIKQN